jgi:hypothetical protein
MPRITTNFDSKGHALTRPSDQSVGESENLPGTEQPVATNSRGAENAAICVPKGEKTKKAKILSIKTSFGGGGGGQTRRLPPWIF